MKKAKWGLDYDYRADKCFKRPVCVMCFEEPVPLDEKGICLNCGKKYKLSLFQKLWLKRRDGVKVEYSVCYSCGKQTMKHTLRRNPVTLKWETCYGSCSNCGTKFMV